MKYQSTRSKNELRSFTDVILEGLAPDGGLYVPCEFPQLRSADLDAYRQLTYAQLAYEIMKPFVGQSIPDTDLKTLLNKTYTAAVFNSEQIAPIEHLYDNIYLQDLSSGPSLAFKDMAMQFLGHLLDYELTRRGQRLCIVGASSGDTVSAAEEALKSKQQIDVVMLTPKEGMSPFQKAQAGSIMDENIYNLSVPGPFDTCQDIVKAINKDAAFKAQYNIGAVNSINWGRILAQMVYYVSAYLQVTENNDQEIDVVVPTGNFGNILAGYYAKKMGLPIRKLIVATNENHVLDRFIQTGIYAQLPVQVTSSPSMDISKASNLERFLFDLSGGEQVVLNQWMETFEANGSLDLSALKNKIAEKYHFDSGSASHDDRQQVIKAIYDKTQRIIDPHTAAGVKVAEDQHEDAIPKICMETAKPTKFEAAIQDALGFVPERGEQYQGLEAFPQRFVDMPSAEASDVKSFIESHL